MSRGATSTLPARLDALAAAVEVADGRLAESTVAPAREVTTRAGERLRLSTHHTVAALAGATGSGKSSLFNALAGLDIARVGIRRPTTSEALACVWGADGAGPLLSWLGIPARHQLSRESELDPEAAAKLEGLVLLDLPDHDSTTLSHRLEVDRLVGLVDVFVWVLDPQKYADAALHERYLRPLSGHAAGTVIVLNQVDRLTPDAREQCMVDLRRLLVADGLAEATLLAASASTGEGVPELRQVLERAAAHRRAAEDRLAADVAGSAGRLLEAVGDVPGGGVGRRIRDTLVEVLADSAGVPSVVAAVDSSTRRRARAATGWPVTRWVSRLRPDPVRRLRLDRSVVGADLVRSSLPAPTPVQRARADSAVRRLADDVTAGASAPVVEAVRAVAAGTATTVADRLDRAVVGVDLGVERRPRWWSVAGALQRLSVAVTLTGLGWLLVLWALAWLRVPDPPTPSWHGWPVPTLLLLGGLLGSLLVALVSRVLAAISARRRASTARRRLHRAVASAADEVVVAPVAREAEAWRSLREHALTARS